MACLFPECEREPAADYPACSAHAKQMHFPHRHDCKHCLALAEAERLTEPMLRLVGQVEEINRCYSDEPVMRADFIDERIAAIAA